MKRYRVIVDGGAYTVDLTEAEVEELYRVHQGFCSIREVIQLDAECAVKEHTFDFDQLAQEIADYV